MLVISDGGFGGRAVSPPATMKIQICREEGCHNEQTTNGFCRLHYLKNWKRLKEESKKKAADKLNRYVDGLCKKFPEKYVDVIRREIKTGKGDLESFDSDPMAKEEGEEIFGSSEFDSEENLDRLIHRIKVDVNF